MGRGTDCPRDAPLVSLSCVVIRKSKSPLRAVMEIVRNDPSHGGGRGPLVSWLVCKFLVCSCWSGMNGAAVLPGALGLAWLVEMLPVVCSKNSGGNVAEGKRRGLLWELGGAPHPLPLPARPYVRKGCRFRGLRSGRVQEPAALTLRRAGPERGRPGQRFPSPGRRSELADSPAALAGQPRALGGFSHCLWACTGPGNSWGRMWLGFLKVARQASSTDQSTPSPDLCQLAFPLPASPPLLTCASVAPWTVCRDGGHGPKGQRAGQLGTLLCPSSGASRLDEVEAGSWVQTPALLLTSCAITGGSRSTCQMLMGVL